MLWQKWWIWDDWPNKSNLAKMVGLGLLTKQIQEAYGSKEWLQRANFRAKTYLGYPIFCRVHSVGMVKHGEGNETGTQ